MVDIVACTNSQILASRIAGALGARLIPVERKVFPDGELYVRLLGEPGDEAVVVQSLSPKPNDALVELILVSETLRDLGVGRIAAVIPYMAYLRQDTRFNPGEAVSAEIIGRLVRSMGYYKIVTVDMHLHRVRDPSMLLGPAVRNLSAASILAEYAVKTHNLRNPVIIGPDEEAEQWAKKAAEPLGAEYTVFEKKRISPEEVILKPRGLPDLKNRDVVIVDDIISTGGTMAKAVAEAYKNKAGRVVAAATHAVLAPGALGRIYGAGAVDVVATDTIESPISMVSVARLIVEELKRP